MEQSTEKHNTTVINLKRYKEVILKWQEMAKESSYSPTLPVTEMLEEFGLSIIKLVHQGEDILFQIVDYKKYLLAKLKYNL